jgi:hypothetical protein
MITNFQTAPFWQSIGFDKCKVKIKSKAVNKQMIQRFRKQGKVRSGGGEKVRIVFLKSFTCVNEEYRFGSFYIWPVLAENFNINFFTKARTYTLRKAMCCYYN